MDRYSAKKQTKEKRKAQICKVYEVKIDRSHLSNNSTNHLVSLFREAKWYYNYCLSQKNINDSDSTAKSVPVKVGDTFEDRTFSVLTAQMKQSIKNRIFNNLSSLKVLKQNGFRVGRLKFKKEVNSIPLKQLGDNKHSGTYYLDRKRSRIRIQGMKQWLRVRGLEQIPEGCEVACGTLVRKCNDFYLNVTTFEDRQEKMVPNASIGIDFGCETQLTFSDGTKVEFQVPPTKRLRRLDRKIMRLQQNGKKRSDSKKRRQDQRKRQREYERISNRKEDIRHKVVSAITKSFKYVCFQDESIHAWHAGNHGKKVQHSGIGGIIADLKHKSHTPCEVDRFFPSTQVCPKCGQLNKLTLKERTYECDCGFVCDRDIKSSICIEMEGLRLVPVDYRDFKAREISPNTFFDALAKVSGIKVSKVESKN